MLLVALVFKWFHNEQKSQSGLSFLSTNIELYRIYNKKIRDISFF